MTTITLEDGKYTIEAEGGICHALRHGERWRDMTGDKLVGAMVSEIESLTAERDALRASAERFNFLCDCDNDQALDILCELLGKRDELIDLVDALIKEKSTS